MSDTANNLDLLKRAYRHWADTRGQSIDYWLAIVSDDIRIQSAADEYAIARFGVVPQGKEGVRRYLEDIVATWQMELYDVQRYVAAGDQVVAVANIIWRHRKTQKCAVGALVDVWTFKNGKACALLEVFDTASMVAAATPSLDLRSMWAAE